MMKVTLVQSPLAWENAEANLQNFSVLLTGTESTDLIILPEMFSSGFTMAPGTVAETMDGPSVNWMRNLAAQKDCAVAGSLVIVENGKYYNRLIFMCPDGTLHSYDKRHLFSHAGEDNHYTAGREKVIVDYKGWKICLQVCYDLRFPVFARNNVHYDLLLYVANWPTSRIYAWDTLLKARAIENVCFTVGVNRIGADASGQEYCGHSKVVDHLGQPILECADAIGAYTVTMNRKALKEFRIKFGVLNDMDKFTLLD